ncbi:glycosyltransferase family 2 protein [Candidatus Gottesmanbacteria bacterium]|nr:glycosyltransferase family 2 protein [Candidatus Gottesmanbacteria bacterium]
MAKPHRTSLIILSRNEINGLRSLIKHIPVRAMDECFAVDYHSTDGTVELLRTHGIQVYHQKKPGRSEAFRIGAAKASGDILIFFSPDGNENPKDIPRLITEIKNGADIAIASRFMPASRNEEDDQLFKWRKWANLAFTMLANLCFRTSGPYITDTINGYRAITKQAFQTLNLDAEGFAIEFQMTIRALKHRMIIKEIPTIEGNRIGGASGSLAIPTGFSFIGYLLRELVNK